MKWMFFRGFLALVVVLCASSPGDVQGKTANWSYQATPIPWYLRNTPSLWGGRSASQMAKIIRDAFRILEGTGCSFIQFRYMGLTNREALHGDGLNVIEWTNKPLFQTEVFNGAVGKGGYAPVATRNGEEILDGDVWVQPGKYTDKTLILLLAHELGHTIGLPHSTDRNSIMAQKHHAGTSLQQSDRQAICKKYPSSQAKCTSRADCPQGLVCMQGSCKRCQGTSSCGNNESCSNGLCVLKCKKTPECPLFHYCGGGGLCEYRGRQPCRQHSDCRKGGYCRSGWCRLVSELGNFCKDVDKDCLGTQVCDFSLCNSKIGCPAGLKCWMVGEVGTCERADKKTQTFCTILCHDKACPEGFECLGLATTSRVCIPKLPQKDGPFTPKKGIGCSATGSPLQSEFQLVMFLSLFFFCWRLVRLALRSRSTLL